MQESNTEAKLSDISAALSVSLQQDCSCSLAVQQSLFSCLGTEDSQTVVFLARLSYTALPGVDLPSLLTTWVGSTPPITVASTQLQVDNTCPMVIDSLEPDGCNVNPPTDPPTNSSTDPLNNSASDAIVIAVAVGVVVLLLMIVILAIAIATAVMVCCRKCSKYRYALHVDVQCTQPTHDVTDMHSSVLFVFSSCCAGPTVPSPTRCTSMSAWAVGLGAWPWLV